MRLASATEVQRHRAPQGSGVVSRTTSTSSLRPLARTRTKGQQPLGSGSLLLYGGEPIYRAVAERQPDPPAAMNIPPRSTAVPSPTASSTPSQRDGHIATIRDTGPLGWQTAVVYGRRSLAETAMFRTGS